MIEHTLSLSKAQQEIIHLPDQFTESLEATIVTRRGKKVMAILPYYTYKALLETIESLQETLEIVQDEEMMAAIREGERAIERGETIAWEDMKKELEKLNEAER
jgi:PHD/YefM family antitoxin component YafN of YafNO toxin-antitoxin module